MIFNVGDSGSAKTIKYDNSKSGLESDNVQGAVDELNDSLGGLRFGTDGDGNVGYYGADDSLIPFKKSIKDSFAKSSVNGYKHTFSIPDGVKKILLFVSCTSITSARFAIEGEVIVSSNRIFNGASGISGKFAHNDHIYEIETNGIQGNILITFTTNDVNSSYSGCIYY